MQSNIIDLSKIKKVFFAGIGGIGISAIARMLFLEGKEVSGSDMSESPIIDELKSLGIEVTIGQGFELIPPGTDLIVYTIAIAHYDQAFFKQITGSGIPHKSYPEMLGIVTDGKYVIAVSGTHGKTTTTAMIAKAFIDTKHDPTVIVGSLLKESKSNFIPGKGNFFILEACEYERSFLNIKPNILIITNIEEDHLDYYRDLADIKHAFKELVLQTRDAVIYNGADKNASAVMEEYQREDPPVGIVDFTKFLDKVPKLSVPGNHNRMNAAAVLGLSNLLNFDEITVGMSLEEFSGTSRRLDKKGKTQEGTIVYDDYAHHPTEIKASLQALRELYPHTNDIGVGVYPAKKITVLFQPHLYSRTKALFNDFAKSFKDADRILLLPIYFAREAKDPSVSSEKLAEAINLTPNPSPLKRADAQAFPDFESAEKAVLGLNLGPNDVFVTMGAGEAYKVADKIFKLV